ncbi:MAG: DNA polymerase III subunit delta [Acidobacteriota bacterium]
MPNYSFFEFFKSLENRESVSPVNFFFGFNEFMGEILIKKISSDFLEEKSDFNFRRFYFDSDDDHSWQEIIDEAKSSSFFLQSRKLLIAVIRDQKKILPSKSDIDMITKYIKEPNPNTILIIYLSLNLTMDDFKTLRKSKVGKLINILGSSSVNSVDLDKITDRQAREYIKSYLKGNGISITASAIEKLLEIKGDDFISILHQLDKMVIADVDDNSIDSEDIDEVITGIEAHSIWDLTEAIEKEDANQYLKILQYLFTNGIKPTLIIGTLITHYNKIFTAKFLLERNFTIGDVGKVLNQPTFFLKRFIGLVNSFTSKRLKHILKIVYKLDFESKTIGENSAKVLLENFIFQIKGE